MKKNAMVATGNGMIRKKVKVSEIVTSAVNIYSPSELGEHHIQDLADEKKFDEAIHLILKKVELLRAEEKNDLAEKYQTVVQWLEAAKQRARESREESE